MHIGITVIGMLLLPKAPGIGRGTPELGAGATTRLSLLGSDVLNATNAVTTTAKSKNRKVSVFFFCVDSMLVIVPEYAVFVTQVCNLCHALKVY